MIQYNTKLVKYILLFFTIGILAGCASDQTLVEKYGSQSDQQIFAGGEKELQKGNMDKASEHFEALQALYPFGDYARQGQLDLIYAYYANDEYASSEAAAERYAHLYPIGPNTDYAYYMKGLAEFTENSTFFQRHFAIERANRDLTAYEKAFVSFEQLIQHYPDSVYSADAHQRLVYLRDMFAQYYINVAEYYYARKAYVAAAEQAAVVVKHYQRTKSMPDALVIMVKSYRKLGLTQQADDALAVLQLNYPDSISKL
jgi:outer membrane protein assembly factor BamD